MSKAKGGSSDARMLDADAPVLIESYQNETDTNLRDRMPNYTYATDPSAEQGTVPVRSWDEAARAKATPIEPRDDHTKGHVYIDVNEENTQPSSNNPSSFTPAPVNASITGYTTALGWNLSKLCVLPYVFPPFTSFIALVWETENDLVRFHGYQSALASAAVILMSFILRAIFGWYTLSWLMTRVGILASWYAGYIAHHSATALEREPFLPYFGPMAVSFVGEE
ncbi:hypothetical protein MYAM1_002304 [Malassezia yamatoensis]|uniref:Uncharacterized protein n=1 Tax=Malassezia yamatoensis TaxID=253288 RepID=A0AAJ5YSD6_9BASI|nr:hypothetical protein MYAM1_002304 [Malassezia yamatoensis]